MFAHNADTIEAREMWKITNRRFDKFDVGVEGLIVSNFMQYKAQQSKLIVEGIYGFVLRAEYLTCGKTLSEKL